MNSPFELCSAALLTCVIVGCGDRQAAKASPTPAVVFPQSQTVEADRKTRPPTMLWWQGAEPTCSSGELEARKLTWGSVYWCSLPNGQVDRNLQNDLGRVARCIHDSVSSFQEEPDPEELGAFLKRANSSGLDPVACGVVRRDGDVRSYHGRKVLMERTLAPTKSADGARVVRYRFSCTDCLVAAETSVDIFAE